MPAVPTTGSPDIVSLDSKLTADFCDGNFYVDVSPSVFTTGGENDVQGASVQITNPVGVVIVPFETSGFDIVPPMTGVYEYPIPKIANVFQYGTYVIAVRITDSLGDTWTVTKNVNICPPDPKNKNKNEGCLNASLNAKCTDGTFIVILNNVPTYKGTLSTSQVNSLTLEYPTASELSPYDTGLNNFSVTLFDGQYKLLGSVCALYDYGDEVYFNVKYKVKCEKIVRCVIDECCVQAKLAELNLRTTTDCTQAEKDNTASIIVNALWLLKLAQLTESCGEDPSDIIGQLEALLGCSCTCNCNEATPINTNSVVTSWIYRGNLTQSGTSAPTAVVSSFNKVTITWSYNAVGQYIGTLSGTFTPLTSGNTFVVMNFTSQALFECGYNSANSVAIKSSDLATEVPMNGLLNNTSFELSILE
jgi:hypothetical protein